jgi:hypothetical protein
MKTKPTTCIKHGIIAGIQQDLGTSKLTMIKCLIILEIKLHR